MNPLGRNSRLLRSLMFLIAFSSSGMAFASEARSGIARLPMIFEANRGQAPSQASYLLRGSLTAAEFQKDGVLLQMPGSETTLTQLKMRLLGTLDSVAPIGEREMEGRSNYLIGSDSSRWIRGVPNFREVKYRQLYPGIDLVFYGNEGALEHDFELLPGADADRIAFQFDGAEGVSLDAKGDLDIKFVDGNILFSRPVAYQVENGVRHEVQAGFVLGKNGTVTFRLGSYDRAKKLVIDPVLTLSTYISPYASTGDHIATDAQGNSYIEGFGSSAFTATPGAFVGCTGCSANTGVTFISKLSPDGSTLIYSTTFNGEPTGIAVDKSGNALISGWTSATNFPTKNGQPIAQGINGTFGFLISLSADGSSLNYGTLLGSAPSASPVPFTIAKAVAVDASGNAFVTGQTGAGFNITSGALNRVATTGSTPQYEDIFLAKFSPTGSLIYSAVLGTADPQNGGAGPIGATAIAIDGSGNAFVAGQAGLLWPTTSGAYLTQIAGTNPYAAPFVTKVASDGKSVIYSTFLDYAYEVSGIVVLPNGNLFVTGNAAGANYPTTQNAYQQNTDPGAAFLTELNSIGSALIYSTVIGDSSYNTHGIALDPDNNVWLAGQTSNAQFPIVNPVQSVFPAPNGFLTVLASTLTEFDPSGQTLKFSTFLGGTSSGYASSVAVDPKRKVHVSGAAIYGMPTTPGAFEGSVPVPVQGFSGATYAYVAEIDSTVASGALCFGGAASTGLLYGNVPLQSPASKTVQVRNCGESSLTFNSISTSNAAFAVLPQDNTCSGTLSAGAQCTLTVQFAPTAAQDYSGYLNFSSDASPIPASVYLSGSGGVPVAAFGAPGAGSPITFSGQLVGQKGLSIGVQLLNNGTVPLAVSSIHVTSGFVIAAPACPSTLFARQSCFIYIQFAPTTAGTINGTLSVSSNDPVNPTITESLKGTAFATYPVPTITSLMNPSYPINSGTTPISINVGGTSFFPASVVYINGVAQQTTYVTDSFLVASFDPSILKTVGQVPVTVFNPTPGGGTSAPYPLIAYRSIAMTISALASDPVSGLLYASIPSVASQNANTVIPINPATGAMMTPIAVSNDPRKLAISDDGSEMYVSSSAGVLQRVNLKSLAVEKTFNLPIDTQLGQTYAQEMHVVPGSPKSIVLALFTSGEDGAAFFNDSGLVNWIPGSANSPHMLFVDSFAFTSPSTFYGLPETSSFFTQVQVASSGLSYAGDAAIGFNQQTGSKVRSDGTLLYTNSGQVWDPTSQKLLGTYVESNGSQPFYTASVLPAKAEGRTYFLDAGGGSNGFQGLSIDIYNQANYALLGSVGFADLSGLNAADLVRWGANGFAFRVMDDTGNFTSKDQLVIATSELVAPSGTAPIPILGSVAPTSVPVGGAAYTMQLAGTGFTGDSTVLINGSARTTTFVSSSSLSAQVLATDIATAGQLNVQVMTPAPGGGTSNSVIVAVNAPQRVAPTVTVTPSASSVTIAQPLAVTIALTGGGSKPVPTGSIVLTASGFTSTPVVLSNGQAMVNIPGSSLPVGLDTLTASYTPDTSSSAIYSASVGTVSVIVATPGSIVSSLTLVPTSSTITNQQTDAVSITVNGPNGQATPTGAVSLVGGSYNTQQTLSSGAATITIPAGALTSGSNTLTATYFGDGTYTGSSATATVTIEQVVINASALSGVVPGSSATANITLNAGSNYSGSMNMSCTLVTSPSDAQSLPTCSLNPTTVNIAAAGSGLTVLTVKTTAASTAASLKLTDLFGLGGETALACMILIGIPRRRRMMEIGLLVFITIALCSGLIGCGGGSSGQGGGPGGTVVAATTAGTYKFSIVGTDSINPTITASTSVSVIVQ